MLRNALKSEQIRLKQLEHTKFNALKSKSAHLFNNNTFFTPHLYKHQPIQTNIAKEYAVLVNKEGTPLVAFTIYNPLKLKSFKLPNLPAEFNEKIHNLERVGFNFVGFNGDILVFMRTFNMKQTDRKRALRSVKNLVFGVSGLVALLYLFTAFCD